MLANFLPRRVQWKELEATGMDPLSDVLQVLNPENAATDYSITYVSEKWSIDNIGDASMEGWWDAELSTPMDDEYIEPGEAFLSSFGSPSIKLKFPPAIK